MSIATELTNLAANRDAIKAAIEAKNPATAPTTALSSFPAAIASIPTGGGGGEKSWGKPAEWPDIEAILEQDVTPQEAISAGATHKWIALYYPGPPSSSTNPSGTEFTTIQFSSPAVYLRISDGVTTTDQAGLSFSAPDNGRMYWVIVYSSSDYMVMPSPCWWSIPECVLCWVHAPDMYVSFGDSYKMIRRTALRRVRLKAFGGSLSSLSSNNTFSNDYSLSSVEVGGLRSELKAINSLFTACAAVCDIDTSAWDTSNVTRMDAAFAGCYSLRSLDVLGWDTSNVTNMGSIFYNCSSIRRLDTSGWETSGVTSLLQTFDGCSGLEEIDLVGWDLGACSDIRYAFRNCYSLATLTGGREVTSDGVIGGSTAYFGKGPALSFDFSSCNRLDHDSLLFLMYWVPVVSGLTLTLGATNLAKLTSDEKAVATAKGWTLA